MEPAIARDPSRRDLVFGWIRKRIQTMKQSFASAQAPRRRTHSQAGIEAMASLGSPPPRIVIGSPVAAARLGPELSYFRSFSYAACSLG